MFPNAVTKYVMHKVWRNFSLMHYCEMHNCNHFLEWWLPFFFINYYWWDRKPWLLLLIKVVCMKFSEATHMAWMSVVTSMPGHTGDQRKREEGRTEGGLPSAWASSSSLFGRRVDWKRAKLPECHCPSSHSTPSPSAHFDIPDAQNFDSYCMRFLPL